jgi:hypothetical protein
MWKFYMGQLQVLEIPMTMVIYLTMFGVRLRDGDANVFGIRRNPLVTICPIKGIELYMDTARQLDIDLTRGYIFRPTTSNGGIQDSPLPLLLV